MKHLNIFTLILLTLSACGQTPNSHKATNETNSVSKDTTTVYKNISAELCSCTYSTMKNNKPSTSMDSCYKVLLLKYTDSLKGMGFDPTTQIGQLKLSNEVVGKLYRNCPGLSKLMQKEQDDENANKLLFKGSIVSQKKLSSGEIEIIMIDSKTKNKQVFKSKSFLYDPSTSNKNIISYETTVEYEIKLNPKTNKDEYYIKESTSGTGVSVEKVEVPK